MNHTVRSTILVTAGSFLVKAFAFLATILLMRGFAPAEFGRIMTMVSLMTVLPVFMDYGSGSSFLKFFPIMKSLGLAHRKNHLFGSALLFRTVAGGILFVFGLICAKPLAGLFLKSQAAWPVVVLAFAGGFAASFFQFIQVIFQSDEKFRLLVLSQLLDAMIKAAGAAIVVGVIAGAGVVHGVGIYVAAPVVAATVFAVWQRRLIPRPKLPDRVLFNRFFRFSSWYMISAASIMIFMNFDYLILAAMRPAEDVGYFGSALRLGAMFFILVQAINTVLMPYIGRVTDAAAMLMFFRKAQIRTGLLSIVLLPAVFMGPWLIRWIAGTAYLPAVGTYYWVAMDQIAQLVFTPFMVVLFGINRPRLLAGYVVLEMVLNIIGDLLVVNIWGPAGVAAVTLAVRVIIGAWGSVHLWRGLKHRDGFIEKELIVE